MRNINKNLIFIIILVILPLIKCDLSESYKKIDQKILSFLSNKQRVQEADDAISSVLNLLQDLKGSNVEEQEKADSRYADEEQKYLAAIKELQTLYDDNTNHYVTAQNDFINIQEKKNDTSYALEWIQERIKANSEKIERLAVQRCESNSLFIESLREHQEGLEVLEWLKQDLENLKVKGVIFLEDDEIQSYTDKLTGYSHIYEKEAIAQFVKLGETKLTDSIGLIDLKGSTKQDVGSSSETSSSDDSNFDVQNFDSKVDERNLQSTLTSHVLDMVEQLIENLGKSIENLEKYEIQASREFATFKSKIMAETNLLNQEFNTKTIYLGKLKIDEEVAFSILNKAEETLKKSESLLNSNIEEYNNKKNFYLAEKARRQEENDIIDEVIAVYKEKVVDAQQYLKDKVQDYVEDEDFDKTRESSKKKRTDDLIKETGRIKEIVEEQAKNSDTDVSDDDNNDNDKDINQDEDISDFLEK